MKLFFSLGACSLSPHIVANELGIPLDLVKVDLAKKTTSENKDYYQITAKGYVPALQLDDERILTEGPAIVQYLADLKPEKNLLPKAGSFERAKVQEWLNFIGTELHKNFGPLFNPKSTEVEKKDAVEKVHQKLDFIEKQLENTEFLTSSHLSVADIYLFNVVSWSSYVGIDISKYLALKIFMEKMSSRKSVKDAIDAEHNFK